MRILIIGGARFIGPHVVRRLSAVGHEMTLFHRGETRADLPAVNEIFGDRRDLGKYSAQFKAAAPDVVLDMFPYTEEDARVLVSVFKGVARRLVAISSADVYRAYGRLLRLEAGEADPIPSNEDAPLREVLYPHRTHAEGPDDFKYHYEKILVERVVLNDAELPGTVLRLPAVYGPNDPQHRLLGYLRRMNDKRTAILLDEGLARWRWTRGYVENVADAIAVAVTDERAANRVYNVGEADALTETDWIRSIGRAAEWDGEVVALPENLLPEHLKSASDFEHQLVTDTNRIRAELGYAERVSRDEALRRTIDWERANPPAEVYPAEIEYPAEDQALSQFRLP